MKVILGFSFGYIKKLTKMKNIYDYLLQLIGEKKKVALATIIETKGSAPQGSGASAMFSSEGFIEGTQGRGLLES